MAKPMTRAERIKRAEQAVVRATMVAYAHGGECPDSVCVCIKCNHKMGIAARNLIAALIAPRAGKKGAKKR